MEAYGKPLQKRCIETVCRQSRFTYGRRIYGGINHEPDFRENKKTGIIPVVVIEDKKYAEPLAEALCKGGLPCAEVTFRTAAAAEAIQLMKNAHPEMLVGAGTVLTIDQVDTAIAARSRIYCKPWF